MRRWSLIYLLATVAAAGGCGSGGGSFDPDPGDEPPDGPPAFPAIELTQFATGFVQPTHVTTAGDGSGRLFVVERRGSVQVVTADGMTRAAPLLDISERVNSAGSEQGLLSIAFAPGFPDDAHVYVNYTNLAGDTVVARFPLSGDPLTADVDGEERLLTVEQPFANHNGGLLAFGPDGFLYIGLGDGGSGGDPLGHGQDRSTLLGSILRIDVGGDPYAIPPGNPFGDEIWAFGLRNPWRFSFDRATGDLYIADVGQSAFEEVNFQPAASAGGENYGWNIMEGLECFGGGDGCDMTGLTLPVIVYGHELGCSITGGFVYRGAAQPALQGLYLYGDFCSGRIWGMARDGGEWVAEELLHSPASISTFGQDDDGEVYVADFASGTIFRIVVADG